MSNSLLFKSVSMRNFRSIGQQPISVDLQRSQSTLVTGQNGSGKSTTTIIALCYVLFNKSYTKCKLPMLINSTNNKQCVVECEFSVNGKEYKVKRGMKPAVFEIYEDSELLKSEAAAKDYQAVLESIIGMDYKVFTQVVVLNKAQYQPFMTLSKPDRRYLVEQILDIDIFTKMSEVTKKRIKDLKVMMYDLDHNMDLKRKDIQRVQAIIDTASAMNDNAIANKNEEISITQQNIDQYTSQMDAVFAESSELIEQVKTLDIESLHKELSELQVMHAQASTGMDQANKRMEFFNQGTCPTCTQELAPDLVRRVQKEIGEQYSTDEMAFVQSQDEMTDVRAEIERQTKILNAAKEKSREWNQLKEQRDRLNGTKDLYMRQLKDLQETDNNIDSERVQLKDYTTELTCMEDSYKALDTKMRQLNTMSSMLREDGIKSEIIRQYLPFINKQINKYLGDMDFYVNFILDEEFNETIMIPGKEKFQYENFSDGQMRRIDIAILLTWLDIARSKNSVSTNLLIMDEILENLDSTGVKDVVDLFRINYSDLNLFVVSQRRDEFMNLFRSNIHYRLEDNFTVI